MRGRSSSIPPTSRGSAVRARHFAPFWGVDGMADMCGLEPHAAKHKGSSPLLPTILTGISSAGLERTPDKRKVSGSSPECPTSDTISETHLGYTTQQIVSIRLAAILSESSVVPLLLE